VRSISGKPSSECDEIVLGNVPTEMRSKVSASLEHFEIAAIQEAAPKALYPDVTRVVETLARSHKLFVVSNCSVRYLEIFHRHSRIGNLFSDMECFGRTERLKHENIRALVERHKLASPCYIGDTAGDEEVFHSTGAGIALSMRRNLDPGGSW
jgi:phosphoglycolate phosphatase